MLLGATHGRNSKVSIALTGEQVSSLKSAVASGEYATTSEIVREALRDWQRKREAHGEDLQRLRQLWLEGKHSGPPGLVNLNDVRRKAQLRLKETASGKKSHAN